MVEHGCTVLYRMERMAVCSSWVCPCWTRVAGAREFRGTRAHASRLPQTSARQTLSMTTDRLGTRQKINITICSSLFFFLTSKIIKRCHYVLYCHYYENVCTGCCTVNLKFPLNNSFLPLHSDSLLNSTTRMNNVFQAQPFRVERTRSGIDEQIVQQASKRTPTERCYHRNPISS
jgi:hypothetical protein